MAKKVINTLKLNLRGGAANPAPPVGPILGQAGVNIMDFCNKYNEMTKEKRGEMLPALVTVYEDRSFSIEIKLPPVSAMIMKVLNLKKGSGEPNSNKVGELTMAQVTEIAQEKLPDLNTTELESAKQMVIGTARSMGVDVENVEYVSHMSEEDKFAAQASAAEAEAEAEAETEETGETTEEATEETAEQSASASSTAEPLAAAANSQTTEVKE